METQRVRVCVSTPVIIHSIRDEGGEINVTINCSVVPLCALILCVCVRACVHGRVLLKAELCL